LFLDLEIDWDQHILKGNATLDLNRKPHADTLILDTRQLKINSVKSESGISLNFWLGDSSPVFGRPLYIVNKAENKKVIINYQTSPEAPALQWLTPDQTHDKQFPFLYSQSQAILARTWVPCQDAPAVKFTYKARIKTQPGFLALMSATNPTEVSADGVYNFEMEQPISSYLLALSSGKIAFKNMGSNCGIYAEQGMLDKAVYEFSDMQKMIDDAGNLYGKYGWKRYDVLVLPPGFPFGGMENPRLTFATPTVITGDKSMVSLIAHELAHSWSGNLVTNATWNDFWLNEGFTVYFEQRIMEQLYGKDYEQMRRVLAWGDLQKTIATFKADSLMADTRLKLDLTGRDPDEGLSDIAYEKGRFFLCHLEKTVGRKNWDAFLKSYFTKHAHGFMNTEDFIKYLNSELLDKNTHWKVDARVDDWVYGEGLPDENERPVSVELEKIDRQLETYFNAINPPPITDTIGFTTYHWQYFIREFAKKATLSQVTAFDKFYKFSNRGNAEITCDWFMVTIQKGFKANRPQLKNFLCSIGRRKFVLPLFEALAETPEGKTWATTVFAQAKPGYHAVTSQSVEEVLEL
jgi:aminopeptidase N